jgi:hypothetical protein
MTDETIQGSNRTLDNGVALPNPVARDDLLGLGERTVDDGALAAVKRTLAPFEVGCRPSPASRTPALTSSSVDTAATSSGDWTARTGRLEEVLAADLAAFEHEFEADDGGLA